MSGQELYDAALQFLDAGRLLQAEQQLKKIQKGDKAYFLGISLLATLAHEYGHNERSIAYLKEALPLAEVDDATTLIGLATVYKAIGDADGSLKILEQVYRDFPKDYTAATMYADSLSNSGQYIEARAIMEGLLELFPNEAGLHSGVGDILEKEGNLDAALECYHKAVELDPHCLTAYIKIIAFNGWSESSFDASLLEELANSCCLVPTEIALIHNSLGHLYEAAGEYQKSFDHYKACNLIYRSAFPETLITHPWTVDQLRNTYTSDLLDYANKEKQSPLVFIFGMSRSGSTLLEQVLINSPDVDTLGEFRGISAEIESLGKRIGDDLTEDTFPEDCSELGDQYLSARVGDIESKFIIDKMPSNHNYIGLLYLLFPNAKFIYTRRDPAAVCFSNWTVMYREGHEYTYTFKEVAEQYKFHEKVMDFWLEAMPDAIHVVDYEDVVNDFDGTIGKLCEYIGIEFTDSMRDFHKKKRKVDTASVGQVTKPLYTTSLDRVGQFGSNLDELKELLHNA